MGRPSRYPEEFRREAVALYRGSDRSRVEVAKPLGISDGSLAAWVKEDAAAKAPGAFSSQYRRARAALLADLALNPGQLRGYCSQPMYPDQDLDADHGRGHLEHASRLLHARCNRQRGAG